MKCLLDRVKRALLPALELIVATLRERQPEPCPRITLVHGDAKPGNYGFVGDDVGVVRDWEVAMIGDPTAWRRIVQERSERRRPVCVWG